MKQPMPCGAHQPAVHALGLVAAQQDRRARARHLAHGAAVERQPGLVGAEREVHAGRHPQLAGARVQPREERLACAGHARGVVHHAAVNLVRLERSGHRLGGPLEPQLVPGAPRLGLEQRRSLHGHRREVGHHLDARAGRRCRAAARGRARPAGSRRAGARTAVRRRQAITEAIRNERQTSPARSSPSASISSASRSGAASQASTRGSSSGRPRSRAASTSPRRPRSSALPAAGWRASLSSGDGEPTGGALEPAAFLVHGHERHRVHRAAARGCPRPGARTSRSVQPLGSRLVQGVGRVLEVKGVSSVRSEPPARLTLRGIPRWRQ